MDDKLIGRKKSFPGRLSTLLCMWFLAEMLVSMLLSGIYSFVGLPLPPLFYFLSAMIYLSGGLLGGMSSRESLHKSGLLGANIVVALFILVTSIGFLFLSIVFVVIGLQHL